MHVIHNVTMGKNLGHYCLFLNFFLIINAAGGALDITKKNTRSSSASKGDSSSCILAHLTLSSSTTYRFNSFGCAFFFFESIYLFTSVFDTFFVCVSLFVLKKLKKSILFF